MEIYGMGGSWPEGGRGMERGEGSKFQGTKGTGHEPGGSGSGPVGPCPRGPGPRMAPGPIWPHRAPGDPGGSRGIHGDPGGRARMGPGPSGPQAQGRGPRARACPGPGGSRGPGWAMMGPGPCRLLSKSYKDVAYLETPL